MVVQDFEGAADCISLMMDGIRRRSAVRTASTAAAEEHEKLLREQQIAGNAQPSGDGSIGVSRAHQGTPSSGNTLATQQAGESGRAAATPAAGQKDGVIRRVAIPGVARKKKASVFKMSPENPLFKTLSAGEGGTMSTRTQPAAAAALR